MDFCQLGCTDGIVDLRNVNDEMEGAVQTVVVI